MQDGAHSTKTAFTPSAEGRSQARMKLSRIVVQHVKRDSFWLDQLPLRPRSLRDEITLSTKPNTYIHDAGCYALGRLEAV